MVTAQLPGVYDQGFYGFFYRCYLFQLSEIIMMNECFSAFFLNFSMKGTFSMPQKVKIQTGFSEKTTENYQSQQYSVALEMDCSVNGTTREIEEASAKLFNLCRKIVASQKGVNVDNLLKDAPVTVASSPVPSVPAASTPSTSQAPARTNGTTKPATGKQIRYALELLRKSGLGKNEIAAIPASFNKQSWESLSSIEASKIIEKYSKKAA